MEFIKKNLVYIAWATTLVATSMSLFFSMVLHLPPCVLCWYQRTMMYPLLVIATVSILRKDTRNLPYYVLPLSVTGWSIALYHCLLYYHIIPDSLAPCSTGVSCTVRLIEWFGFVTIPLLSFIGFSIINVIMLLLLKYNKHD